MAELKWIKITTDIFDDEKISLIEQMPEGDTIIVIWFKLLSLAGKKNDSGLIYISRDIPYTEDTLPIILRRKKQVVTLALQTLQKLKMIEIVNDIITILNWEKYQNTDKIDKIREQNRLRQQKYREKQKQITQTVTQRNEPDKKRKDKKRKDINSDSTESPGKDIVPNSFEENQKAFHKILWAFFTKTEKEHFLTKKDCSREAPAIKEMITYTMARAPTFNEQKAFLGNFLRTAKYIFKGETKRFKFLEGSPFIPTVIMSGGIKCRILELMKDNIKQQEIAKNFKIPW